MDYDFSETFDLEMLAGRDFDASFDIDPLSSFLINEKTMSRLGWESPQAAVGQDPVDAIKNEYGQIPQQITIAMKIILTGATGMVGKGVLLECLDHPEIEQVLTIGRSPLGMQHPKLKEVIHSDFLDYTSIQNQLVGYDACYLCMGVSSAGMKEDQYRKLTYDYTLTLAKTLLALNPGITCTYVSGESTDSTEKGSAMWARVKGKTENDLLGLGFKQAYMFRPGAILPLRGIKSKTKGYQFIYNYFTWLLKLIKAIAPNSIVNTTQIGLAMINATLHGYEKNIIRPADILRLAM